MNHDKGTNATGASNATQLMLAGGQDSSFENMDMNGTVISSITAATTSTPPPQPRQLNVMSTKKEEEDKMKQKEQEEEEDNMELNCTSLFR